MLGRLKFNITDLVDEILNQLPAEVWSSPTTTFLDPAIGGGQFVHAIENRLINAGHSKENISKRVYGYESNRMRINFAVNKYKLVGNYTNADFLEAKINMNFDVVIGNPPYNSNDTSRETTSHRGQGDNLAKKFTYKSFELLKEDGNMAFIMPYGQRTYSTSDEKHFRENGLYLIDTTGDHFKHVSTEPCVFYFNRTSSQNTLIDNYKSHNRSIPKNNIGNIFKNQPGKLNRIDYEHTLLDSGKYRVVVTTSKIRYTNDSELIAKMNDTTVGRWRVVFNCTTSKGKFGKILIEDPSSILSKSVHCLVCQSKEEAIKLKSHLETPKIQNILMEVKLNACNSKKFLQYIPMP